MGPRKGPTDDVVMWSDVPESDRYRGSDDRYRGDPARRCEAAVRVRVQEYLRCNFQRTGVRALCANHQDQYDAWTAHIAALTGRPA